MKILVINCGSSSLKFQLFDMASQEVLAAGLAERIGEETGALTYKAYPGSAKEKKITRELPIKNHETAFRLAIAMMEDPEHGVIKNVSEIDAIGHRVLHGGEAFKKTHLVDDEVIKAIKQCIPLGPLHNPPNLTGILTAQSMFPGTPQVAVFDTAFHQTMPPKAFLYGLPYSLYEELSIRRYGFHGTSHLYVSKQAAKYLGQPLGETNVITIHLGNGSSLAAVKNGKCFDTSMGMTPLAGVVMGTRTGDLDPAIVAYICKNKNMSAEDVIDKLMNKQSGFKGICGSNDMRDIHARIADGDAKSMLALEMFAYHIKKYVGAYLAALGRVDALVFTAGIGENDPVTRAMICEDMENLGIELDKQRNESSNREARTISSEQSRVKVIVMPTNEELEIASQTLEVLEAKG